MRKLLTLLMILVSTVSFGITQPSYLQIKDLPVFDVRQYGALGDGVTDDYAAIQLAVDAAATNGGGRVLFAPGKTFVSNTQVLISSDHVYFEGYGATVHKESGSFYIFKFGSGTLGEVITGGGVVGLKLTGHRTSVPCGAIYTPTAGPTVVNTDQQVNNLILRDLDIQGFSQYGVALTARMNGLTVDNVRVTNFGCNSGSMSIGIGFVLYPRDTTNNVFISGLEARLGTDTIITTSAAIKLQTADGLTATNIIAQGGTEECIVVSNVKSATISNLYLYPLTAYNGLVIIDSTSEAAVVVASAGQSGNSFSNVVIGSGFTNGLVFGAEGNRGLSMSNVNMGNNRAVISNNGLVSNCSFSQFNWYQGEDTSPPQGWLMNTNADTTFQNNSCSDFRCHYVSSGTCSINFEGRNNSFSDCDMSRVTASGTNNVFSNVRCSYSQSNSFGVRAGSGNTFDNCSSLYPTGVDIYTHADSSATVFENFRPSEPGTSSVSLNGLPVVVNGYQYGYVAGDSTPDVTATNFIPINNSVASTTITNFENGDRGQVLTILFIDELDTTIANGTTISTKDGADVLGTSTSSITFGKYGSKWYELSRSK